ncbi:MAG: MotA/TolQ/ExbB proton channel family protein [Burkholderiales bacterium]|nr:MAG: MotA/TolQ/ExbB proton channel family protein [Burkholderiales bacterium]
MTDSPFGPAALWAQGDAVTRTVAVALFAMSLVSWYLILSRGWLAFEARRAARSTAGFWSAGSFPEGLAMLERGGAGSPFRRLAADAGAAFEHVSSTSRASGRVDLGDWMTECLRGSIDDAAERLQAGLGMLASIGSTAPFVGLFGTVWGIYHALVGIGVSGEASIGKVAGPVGEALIMTAFGLAVAIPAVLAYNGLLRSNKTVIGRLNGFARQLHAYFVTGAPLAPAPVRMGPPASGGA